jgi:hypothetical protein
VRLLGRKALGVTLVLGALQGGCRCGEAPPPPPPPEAPAPAEVAPPAPPTGAQPSDVTTIFEEVTVSHSSATGLRVRPDGHVDLAVGTPTALAWTPVNVLGPDELEAFREELASDDLAGVPDELVPVPGASPDASASTFRLETPKGVRTIRVPTRPDRRIPVLERMERLARGSAVPPVRTRWELVRHGVPSTLDVPCDPLKVPSLAPIVEVLLAPSAESDTVVDATSPVRVRVTWGNGGRVWDVVLHDSGWLARGREDGSVDGRRLPRAAVERVAHLLDQLDPEQIRCP